MLSNRILVYFNVPEIDNGKGCLVNSDGASSVENAFAALKEISYRIREKYSLN